MQFQQHEDHPPMLAVRPEVSSGTMSCVARGTHSATLAGVTAHSANPSYVRVATASPTEKPEASTGAEEGALLGEDVLGDRFENIPDLKSTRWPPGTYFPSSHLWLLDVQLPPHLPSSSHLWLLDLQLPPHLPSSSHL